MIQCKALKGLGFRELGGGMRAAVVLRWHEAELTPLM